MYLSEVLTLLSQDSIHNPSGLNYIPIESVDLSQLKFLGRGVSASVYEVTYNDKSYALKVLKSEREAIQEVKRTKKGSASSHVIDCYGLVQFHHHDQKYYGIILEKADSMLDEAGISERLPSDLLIQAKQLKDDIEQYHLEHYDISPSNLCFVGNQLKLLDFGGGMSFSATAGMNVLIAVTETKLNKRFQSPGTPHYNEIQAKLLYEEIYPGEDSRHISSLKDFYEQLSPVQKVKLVSRQSRYGQDTFFETNLCLPELTEDFDRDAWLTLFPKIENRIINFPNFLLDEIRKNLDAIQAKHPDIQEKGWESYFESIKTDPDKFETFIKALFNHVAYTRAEDYVSQEEVFPLYDVWQRAINEAYSGNPTEAALANDLWPGVIGMEDTRINSDKNMQETTRVTTNKVDNTIETFKNDVEKVENTCFSEKQQVIRQKVHELREAMPPVTGERDSSNDSSSPKPTHPGHSSSK
ncbi:MAG: hypothetical protein P1U61_08470 [Legionellaceae bacterium]|nr:hypothetical protein [Legionellaceae bacterium]